MHTDSEHNEDVSYQFVADTVVFEILHPSATPDQQEEMKERIVRAMQGFLRPNGDFSPEENNDKPSVDSNWRYRLHPPKTDARIIMFSSPTQVQKSQSFSLIPLKLKGHIKDDRTPDDVLRFLNDAYADLSDSFIEVPGKKQGENAEPRFRSINLGDEIDLKSISANWFAGGLIHGKSTGGPGSLPERKPAPTGSEHKFEVRGTDPLECLLPFRRPGAEVAILDTARLLDEFPTHLKDIFTANPSMDVILAPDPNELSSLELYSPPPYHYRMPDHGTFIASIIRFIAPSVKIRLYQVLNDYGVGSFTSVAQGISNAINQRSDNAIPLVVNCSFMLSDDSKDLVKKMKKLRDPDVQALLEMSMKDVFRWATIDNPDVLVVASAGNDGKPEARPAARYPAAFDQILSVAALPKGNPTDPTSTSRPRKYRPSTFSNLAHAGNPSKDKTYSFAVFGGDLVPGTLSPKAGVLGIYIGVIPTQNADDSFSQHGPANPTGYGQWSGTSFAAPIITALLAAQDTELVFTSRLIAGPRLTTADENAVLVKQG